MVPTPVFCGRRDQAKESRAAVSTDIFLQMKQAKDINLKQRAAVKMASRKADRQRLEDGESPVVIQHENSIFPPDYFKQHRILNFASAIGK